jgi:hypothetical protein
MNLHDHVKQMFNLDALKERLVLNRMGSMASTLKDSFEKVCALARWPSPRGVPNHVAFPYDNRMSQWVLQDKLTCATHGKIVVMGQKVKQLLFFLKKSK